MGKMFENLDFGPEIRLNPMETLWKPYGNPRTDAKVSSSRPKRACMGRGHSRVDSTGGLTRGRVDSTVPAMAKDESLTSPKIRIF